MGGCATKPKVLKGDQGEIPAPSSPNESVPQAKEAAASAAVTAAGENKIEANDEDKEVTDNMDDDQSSKRRSLSNLFKEKENKGTAEPDSDNTQSEAEPMKKETLKQELESMTKNQETKEPEKPVEPVSVPPGNIESAPPNEAEPAPEAATAAAAVDLHETQNR